MPIQLSEPQFEALAHRLRQHEISQLGLTGYQSLCELPGRAGRMSVTQTDWAGQVRCFVIDYDMRDDFELVLSANRDNRLTFYLDGNININMRTTGACRDLGVKVGNAVLRSSHGEDQFVVRVPRERRHALVQLRIDRQFFDDWLKRSGIEARGGVLEDLHVYDGRVAYNARWSADVDACLRQMICPDLPGALRLSYLGAKSIELMTLFARELGAERAAGTAVRADRIDRARRLLTEDLARPWTVGEIARRLSWNVSDLQAGFKRRFGLPVHAYLKDLRLRHAARLLTGTRMSVYAIALETGWQCQSRFSSAFRLRFGVTPTTYRNDEHARERADRAASGSDATGERPAPSASDGRRERRGVVLSA